MGREAGFSGTQFAKAQTASVEMTGFGWGGRGNDNGKDDNSRSPSGMTNRTTTAKATATALVRKARTAYYERHFPKWLPAVGPA